MELVTVVRVTDPTSRRVGVDCWLFLELDDGERLPLLTDRGWGSNQPWEQTDLKSMGPDALMVVGPDAPFGDLDEDDMARGHWAHLESTARRGGFRITAEQLSALPHRVEFTEDVIARVRGSLDE